MPTLSSKPIELEILKPQIPLSTLVAIQSMEIFTERMNEMYTESFRKMVENISAMIELQNKAIIQTLAAGFSFKNLFPNGLFNFIPSVIVEGEIEEVKQVETVLLPVTIPITTPRSKMGLRNIAGGNFNYKRRTLIGLSLSNREGRLLQIILENADFFVSDNTLNEKFNLSDTLERSDLIKILKNKFKQNKLKIEIKRQGEGYILINIHPLT